MLSVTIRKSFWRRKMEKCWSMPMAVLVAVLPLVTAAQISTATTAAGKGWSGLPGPAPQFGPAAQPEPPSPSAERIRLVVAAAPAGAQDRMRGARV